MQNIVNWLRDKSLKYRKQGLLHEVRRDIAFIERHKRFCLAESEEKLRQELKAEREKDQPDGAALERLSSRIAEATATRAELEKLKRVAEELPLYIEML